MIINEAIAGLVGAIFGAVVMLLVERNRTKTIGREEYIEKRNEKYDQIWESLISVERDSETLWEEATDKNLVQFAESLYGAKRTIRANLIRITDDDEKKLKKLLVRFDSYMNGKIELVKLRKGKKRDVMTESEINQYIEKNRSTRNDYIETLKAVKKSFRRIMKV